MYQTPSLSTSPHGSTTRVDTVRARSSYVRVTRRRSTTASWSCVTSAGRGRSRSPQPERSVTTASAAAAASARNVSGSARMSLRSAERADAARDADPPTRRNSALASSTARPVGPGTTHQRPSTTPLGSAVDGDAGGRQGLQVPARGGDGDLELGGELSRRHPPPRLHEEERGHQTVRAHRRSFLREVLIG